LALGFHALMIENRDANNPPTLPTCLPLTCRTRRA